MARGKDSSAILGEADGGFLTEEQERRAKAFLREREDEDRKAEQQQAKEHGRRQDKERRQVPRGTGIGGRGLAGGAGEVARQSAEKAGAGPTGQRTAEMLGAIAPATTRVVSKELTAPIVKRLGDRLTKPSPEFETPEKAAMRQTLPEGTQASMAVEMGMAGPAVVKAHP